MRLAFWRHVPAPEDEWAAWSAWCDSRLHEARRFHAEMEDWGLPIDTIRAALGLPERWQRTAQRAWQQVLGLAALIDPVEAAKRAGVHPTRVLSLAPSVVYGTFTSPVGPAGTGNPIHDEALRRARGF